LIIHLHSLSQEEEEDETPPLLFCSAAATLGSNFSDDAKAVICQDRLGTDAKG